MFSWRTTGGFDLKTLPWNLTVYIQYVGTPHVKLLTLNSLYFPEEWAQLCSPTGSEDSHVGAASLQSGDCGKSKSPVPKKRKTGPIPHITLNNGKSILSQDFSVKHFLFYIHSLMCSFLCLDESAVCNGGTTSQRRGAPKQRCPSPSNYIPKYRSGAYALLITLYNANLRNGE